MITMRLFASLVVLAVVCLPALAGGEWWKDEHSWKKPLAEKARMFEDNILRNHWIQGLYPSIVELPPDGSPPDQTTTGNSNIAHSCCWTSNYLAGQAYRYAFTKDPAVREHCREILRALRRLQTMTPKPGLLSRGYVLGHGPSYEERADYEMSPYWHQGTGEFANYRWRGSPSHHNYDDVIHGYGVYYDLAADDEQKELIRRDVHNLMSYILDNNMLIADEYGSAHPFIGFTDGRTPNLRVIMVTSCLKTAYHITGDEKFNRKYLELVEQYGYRTAKSYHAPPKYTDFDDAEHVFGDLDNMFRQEKDPQLLAFYHMVLEALWEVHKDDGQAYYNYMYHALSGKEGNDAAALDMLRRYPTVKVFRPYMYSIRDDIEKVRDPETGGWIARDPLPMNARPLDNEYEWKNSPYQLDGWLSRAISALAVAPEDPMVMLAADDRGLVFRSLDGGATWGDVSAGLGGAQARQVAFFGPRQRFVIAATSAGVYRSCDGGLTWRRVAGIPAGGQAGSETLGAAQVLPARTAADPFWAVMDDGSVYHSLTLNPEAPGEAWELVTELPAPLRGARVAIAPGGEPTVYAALGGRFYSWRAGEGWRQAGEPPRLRGEIKWLLAAGDALYAGAEFKYGPTLYVFFWSTRDAGKTWQGVIGDGQWAMASAYSGQKVGGKGLEGQINSVAVDPRRANRLLCATSRGVFISDDNGDSWARANSGLRIERADHIFAPAETDTLYASTPAGLFESRDDGQMWQEGNLTLNCGSNALCETGSADFLDAYWLARDHGFITEEQANAVPQ